MHLMTDEEVLQNCYKKLAEKNAAKKHKVELSKDKALASGIASSTSLMLMRLTSTDTMLTSIEIQKYVTTSKGLYMQYSSIKGRNPSCLSPTLSQSMDKLIEAVCKHEAEMIGTLRLQETGGDKIDIQSVFDQKKNLNRLGNTLARTIIADAINDKENPIGFIPTFYITDTGKKFHRADCPYCKGRHLSAATQRMVENQKLTPCKCLSELPTADDIDRTCVTAFIDESIHPVAWNEQGHKGKAGSYSYIICWGNLSSESQITDKRVITDGVDYTGENEHIERITETAVGKVLMTLAYDYEYIGQVHIFTDNKPAVEHWGEVAKNSKLAKHFLSVKVSFIPREKNRKADQLGRTRMLLDMPISAYNEAVKNKNRVKELEKRVKQLETERNTDTEIPEVIVAKQVSYPNKPKAKILFFDNIFRSIRSRFDEALGRKAVSNL